VRGGKGGVGGEGREKKLSLPSFRDFLTQDPKQKKGPPDFSSPLFLGSSWCCVSKEGRIKSGGRERDKNSIREKSREGEGTSLLSRLCLAARECEKGGKKKKKGGEKGSEKKAFPSPLHYTIILRKGREKGRGKEEEREGEGKERNLLFINSLFSVSSLEAEGKKEGGRRRGGFLSLRARSVKRGKRKEKKREGKGLPPSSVFVLGGREREEKKRERGEAALSKKLLPLKRSRFLQPPRVKEKEGKEKRKEETKGEQQSLLPSLLSADLAKEKGKGKGKRKKKRKKRTFKTFPRSPNKPRGSKREGEDTKRGRCLLKYRHHSAAPVKKGDKRKKGKKRHVERLSTIVPSSRRGQVHHPKGRGKEKEEKKEKKLALYIPS